ncbi:hypothetical protein D3C74_493170 [compost metagenome]
MFKFHSVEQVKLLSLVSLLMLHSLDHFVLLFVGTVTGVVFFANRQLTARNS